MKKFINMIFAVVMVMIFASALSTMEVKAAESQYIHNPVLNQKAMEDIIVDNTAVYGFRPDPNSDRLGSFADADWSDPVQVEEWKQERIAYHNQFASMYSKWQEMQAAGKSIEEIARTVSAMRNQIRLDSYKDNPEGLAKCKAANLEKYGNENGPTAESLYEKYGSWETVLIKSFSENPGMDACLGLYDDYYGNYAAVGSLEELSVQTYTVQTSDSLSTIAGKYYGDPTKWTVIYNNNKGQIRNPNIVYTGQQLLVPVQ